MTNFNEISSVLHLLNNEESCRTLHRLNWITNDQQITLSEMIVALQEIYPDKWDIQLQIKNTSDPYVYVTIYFPEIHITNSNKDQHVIHDLYVSIPVFRHHRDTIDHFLGARATASYGEYLSHYRHSHLESGYYDTLKFTPFCLGSGEIIQTMMLYSTTRDIEFFKLFLIQLETYLSWESLEGGPHMRMTSIFAKGNSMNVSVIPSDTIRSMFQSRVRLDGDLSSLDLEMYPNGYVSIIDNEQFEIYAKSLVNVSDDYMCYKDEEGNYSGVVREINRLTNLSTNTIVFRDKKIPFKLDFTIPDTSGTKYLHPTLKKHLKNKLEYELNKRKIKATAFK